MTFKFLLCSSSYVILFFKNKTIDYDAICKYITSILERKLICQIGMADEDEVIDIAEEGESSEYKEVSLFEAAGSTVTALAKTLGSHIVPFFLSVIKHFERLVDGKNNHYFRSLGVSTIAEVLRLTQLDPTPFMDNLVRVVFCALADKDPVTRSNAVFCSGIIMQNAGSNGTRFHVQVMDAICPSLRAANSSDPLLQSLRDNAAGATARMLIIPGSPLPLDTVLPLWMAALPLQNDFEEYLPVLNALAFLLVQQQQRMTTFMPRAMETIAAAAVGAVGKTENSLVEPIKNVAGILVQIKNKFPADFAKLMSMLSQDCQCVISKLLA